MGARRLRQIKRGNYLLQQVRRGVAVRRRALTRLAGPVRRRKFISDESCPRQVFPGANRAKPDEPAGYRDVGRRTNTETDRPDTIRPHPARDHRRTRVDHEALITKTMCRI
jgi:hypothetical protein